MTGFAVFLGFVAICVGFGFVNHRLEKRRREALRAAAAQLGLEFAETDETGLQSGLIGFKLFSYGRGRNIRNIVYGRVDGEIEVILFDYAYTSGSGKNRRTYSQTVAFFQSDRLQMPEFLVRPEGWFDKLGQVFGYHDIDLPSHPEFSRRYILRGVEEGAIRAFFSADVARFFENNTGLSVEAKMDRFIVYRPAKRLDPQQWGERLKLGRDAVKVFS